MSKPTTSMFPPSVVNAMPDSVLETLLEAPKPSTLVSNAAQQKAPAHGNLGLTFSRCFTTDGVSPFDQVQWERRNAVIQDFKGKTIFEQKDVEAPAGWSLTATNIVASKYLHGKVGTAERESGVRDLITRVVDTISMWGVVGGYFLGKESATVFAMELAHLLLNQKVAFNSPVWFNVGCDRLEPAAEARNWHWNDDNGIQFESVGYSRPQCSACFINSVQDSMESIMELARTEAMLFKFGSGTGTNFSSLRSSFEGVSGGGVASGPLSFMKGLDAFAGVIKSGGKTRRAAKMAILNVSHPDIVDFIECKLKEDAKAQALMREGYDGASGPDSEAYSSVFYQNANNSVRVSDAFMSAAELNQNFMTYQVRNGRDAREYNAGEILHKIAEATWACGDPGMQFDDTINDWHTCKTSGRINASNPCSEYMFLDDSACNLASFNLMKFVNPDGTFDIPGFSYAVRLITTAMDIIVDAAGYPTERIARNSHDYRPLGLGYANLGALLMSMGLPYDSDEGRDFAAGITAVMTGQAYWQSANMAERCVQVVPADPGLTKSLGGAFPGFELNRDSFLKVIVKHRESVRAIGKSMGALSQLEDLVEAARDAWNGAYAAGRSYGFRNAQVTVLAPTGTIGFMMDCDTTGIEPELALVKYKKLVGGGILKIVNDTVEQALVRLGYTPAVRSALLSYIDKNGTLEDAPDFNVNDLPVFDTAFKSPNGRRTIHYLGHVKMMAAVQPFLSGAISKTVNMPNEATVEDIANAYLESWRLGLKSVAIYRDGSKSNQVLVTSKGTKTEEEDTIIEVSFAAEADLSAPPKSVRHRLPDTRPAVTHKFSIAGHDGYLTVGQYENGQPGEIFITMAKEGSTLSGLMDSFALVFSIALQHGVPLETLVSKLAHTGFEPSGWTGNPEMGYAKSIMDYLARWLEKRFLKAEQHALFPTKQEATTSAPGMQSIAKGLASMVELGDSPLCPDCGGITIRNGSCYKCPECGGTTGCS